MSHSLSILFKLLTDVKPHYLAMFTCDTNQLVAALHTEASISLTASTLQASVATAAAVEVILSWWNGVADAKSEATQVVCFIKANKWTTRVHTDVMRLVTTISEGAEPPSLAK